MTVATFTPLAYAPERVDVNAQYTTILRLASRSPRHRSRIYPPLVVPPHESVWNLSSIAATLCEIVYFPHLPIQHGGGHVDLALSFHPCQRLPSGTAADGRGRGARPSARPVPRSALHGGAAGLRGRVGRGRRVRGALGRHRARRRYRPAGAAVPGRAVHPACRAGDRRLLGGLGRSIRPRPGPRRVRLPQNVHVFPRGRVEELLVQARRRTAGAAGGRQLRSSSAPWRPADFQPDPAGLYTIAVAHGEADLAGAASPRASTTGRLGGRHDRSTPHERGPQVVHYCGTPARPAARGKRHPRLHARSSRRATPDAHQPDSDRRGALDERAAAGRRDDRRPKTWKPGSASGCTRCWKRCRPRPC